MSAQVRGQRRSRLRRILRGMRLNFITLGLLIVLTVLGLSLIRSSLLKNAQETGTALTQIYAAEGESNLTIYETLLTFGSSSISDRLTNGTPREELVSWLNLYFQRVESVLGKGIVDPYMVLDGKILAANPWDGDESYDASSTEWYQKAIQANGEVIFTNVYIDAISQKPSLQQLSDAETTTQYWPLTSSRKIFNFNLTPWNAAAATPFSFATAPGPSSTNRQLWNKPLRLFSITSAT